MHEKLYVPVDVFLHQCAVDEELPPYYDSIKKAVASCAVSHSSDHNNGTSLPDFLTHEPEDEPERAWQNNYKYLLDHSDELSQQYPGKFIAVLNESVYMVEDNPGEMAGKVYRELGNVPLVIDKPGVKQPEQLDLPLC